MTPTKPVAEIVAELLPCPFCGEGHDFGIGRGTEDREGFPTYLYCAKCGMNGPWIYTRDKLAFTSTKYLADLSGWNKRPYLAELTRLSEENEQLKKQLSEDIKYDNAPTISDYLP